MKEQSYTAHQLDKELAALLAKRVQLVGELPPAEVFEQALQQAGESAVSGRLLSAAIEELGRCRRLLAHTPAKLLEQSPPIYASGFPEQAKVACQGVPGAYSHAACVRLFGQGTKPAFCKSFGDVFEAVACGKADFGVLPIENSSAGQVGQVFDLVTRYRLYISAAVKHKVEHCLAARPGTPRSAIKHVYSHPQALAQCTHFLQKQGLVPKEDSNTAAAALRVSQSNETLGCICSRQAAAIYGLAVLEENIQDCEENYTRFICISKQNLVLPEADTVSITVAFPNRAGALMQLLMRFAACSLDLTRILSMPLGTRDFNAIFYLDFRGNLRDNTVVKLLSYLIDKFEHFRFLGSYREVE